jgi:hypothetical protein
MDDSSTNNQAAIAEAVKTLKALEENNPISN